MQKRARWALWTPYRYAVYLLWTRKTAQTADVRPGAVEFTLL